MNFVSTGCPVEHPVALRRGGLSSPDFPEVNPSKSWMLLRKEVIQPQVPLRLPCYDFIPITSHTLGTYPPCGSEQLLRVQRAFMM